MSDETATDSIISIDFDPPKRRRKAPGEAAGTRKEHDTYDTPPELALACAEWVRARGLIGDAPDLQNAHFYPPARSTFRILEPTSGGGPFVKAARQTWPHAVIAAIDIRPECQKPCEDAGATIFACADSLTLPSPTIASADLVLTNPPFKLADALVRHFYAHMNDGAVLALLLAVTFIACEDRWVPEGDTKRRRGRPPGPGLFTIAPLTYMVPIVPRPSFLTVDGKSTSPKFEAALFVWHKNPLREDDRWDAAYYARIPREPIRWEKSK